MKHTFKSLAICAILSITAGSTTADTASADFPEAGSVGGETGLEAWEQDL